MEQPFTHLHCHSNFSLLDGVSSIPKLLDRAKALGMKRLALTDTNNLYGSVEFYEMAKERGIAPVTGSEITLADGTSLVLLVKNEEGYANLCRILTEGHVSGGHGKFALEDRTLRTLHRGLIALSGGKDGRITRLLERRKVSEALDECHRWKSVFRRDFYLEMQWYGKDDALLNYKLHELAETAGVGVVATNDVHFALPGEASLRPVLRAISENTTVAHLGKEYSPEQYLKSSFEMKRLFKKYPKALAAAEWIARECGFAYALGKPVFPTLEIPGGEDAEAYLRRKCSEGVRARYGTPSTEVLRRLEYELTTILSMGFAEYFLIVQDIVDYCRANGIPCVGRGSAGDSLVAYVLGITQVDPVRYNLYFERFLNPERKEPPDIDLDLCWKRRDEVIDYVYKKYGHARTAMICTFNTFAMRSAVADAAKAHGFPEDEARTLTKYLPHRGLDELNRSLDVIPECKDHPLTGEIYTSVLKDARSIAGFPRHLSVHPGGIVIAPDQITRFTALEESGKGIITTQHDMYSIEKLGLVKMDLLGVRGLSILADCISHVKESDAGGAGPGSLDGIPADDADTFAFIQSAETIGCFQLESPAMRGLVRAMKIESLEDVIVGVALIRPGPAEGGMKEAYIRRRAGLEATTYPIPELESVLSDTYGILVYQEQVLQVASVVAGFSYAEADLLRRAMTKSRTKKTMDEIRQRFLAGAARKGTSPEAAERVWSLLAQFVGYGFNKAHSATYGLLAYQSAYLKRHCPAPFMTAVLNNGGGFYDAAEYVEEARRMGITILPPDVNRAREEFVCEGNAIRIGLGMVKDLTRRTISMVLEQRERKPFRDFFDFAGRTGVGEREAVNLIKCGALRSLEESEPLLLAKAKIYYRNKKNAALAGLLTEGLYLEPYPLSHRIAGEVNTLGVAVSAHPLSLYTDLLMDPSVTPAADAKARTGERVKVAGWLVTSRRVPVKDNTYMKFITLEDPSGLVEAVLFPAVYRRFGHVLKTRGPYVVIGRMESRTPGNMNLVVEKIILVSAGERVPRPLAAAEPVDIGYSYYAP